MKKWINTKIDILIQYFISNVFWPQYLKLPKRNKHLFETICFCFDFKYKNQLIKQFFAYKESSQYIYILGLGTNWLDKRPEIKLSLSLKLAAIMAIIFSNYNEKNKTSKIHFIKRIINQ